MSKSFIILISCFVLLNNTSCTQKIERSIVVGKYIAKQDNGIDILELKSDGTYIYYYRFYDGMELKNSNKWEIEYQNNETRITFDKFIFGLTGYGTKRPGFWNVKVEKSKKTLRLCIDPDINYCFEKQ